MIANLRGRLLEKHPNRVIIDVQGVGYDVHVPLSTFYEMADSGAEIALRVHTHVREDALMLFGFATLLELQIFERLISVSGIGPKLALAVLSGIETNELVTAIRQADVARLTAIPGIGKKTAERIGLELKDKMATLAPAVVEPSSAAVATETLRTDVLSALVNLGYHRPLAERAVEAALKKAPGGRLENPFENTLKYALRELSK
jgi:Holliday junction DNA helicase RuvA